MELLMWLEQIEIWRLQREHSTVKEEVQRVVPDDELPQATYPTNEMEVPA